MKGTVREGFGGWVIVRPDEVPQEWRGRGIEVVILPLAPGEAGSLFASSYESRKLGEAEQRLVRLVAEGHSAAYIARELGVSRRSVYRRLARMRERFSAVSIPDLARKLGEAGTSSDSEASQ